MKVENLVKTENWNLGGLENGLNVFFFFNECNAKGGNHFFSTLRIQYANVSLTHSGVDTVVVSRPELKNARAISRSETGNTTG